MESKDNSSADEQSSSPSQFCQEVSSTNSMMSSIMDNTSVGGSGDCPKCSICKKRLARKNCIKQACVKCCNISTCQPHIQAKLEIQRKQSILDGTDPITIAANLKRLSKVKDNGSFMEGNIHYFGDTVVLWNVVDFMCNSKWIDDAVRRCVKNRQRFNTSNGIGDGSLVCGNKRKRSGMDEDCKQERQKKKKLSRKQRFKVMFS